MSDYNDRLKQPGVISGTKRVKLTSIPEGNILEATYFGAYRESSGNPQSASNGKYINIGFSYKGHDYYLESKDTALTEMVIVVNGTVYLRSDSVPFAVFEATTSVEDCVVVISGQLKKEKE